jgi:DNA modification methylase
MTINELVWRTEKRTVDSLIPNKNNPRILSKTTEANLKKSLEKFNLVEIPAIDKDNKIIAGHQRVHILKLLNRGGEEIDVRVPNRKLTEEEYTAYLLTSNAVTGEWDFELLQSFDMEMLADIGFDMGELSLHWETGKLEDDNFDEKKALESIIKPVTKVGDIIKLGNHRLICGDSNDPAVLAKLFGEEKTSMIYADPVYNINLDYNKGLGGKQQYGADVEDDRTDTEYIDFLKNNIDSALSVSKPDCHVFYWNTEQHIWILQTLYREFNISNKRVCLWIKNGHNPTPGVAFNKCYEPCVYGTKGKPYLADTKNSYSEILNGDITNGNEAFDDINLWTAKRITTSEYTHATSKPPTLHHKALLRCTKPNDIVLDTFGGSGSTLIACDQLKRRAYLVELEPVFCDIIVARYEALTKQKVVRL